MSLFKNSKVEIKITLVLVLLAVLVGGGFFYYQKNSSKQCETISNNNAINAFICSQNLENPQEAIINQSDIDKVKVTHFVVSYGEPQDCPAGCFYDKVRGVELKGEVYSYDPIKFNVKDADITIFSEKLWEFLKTIHPAKSDYIALTSDLTKDPNTPSYVLSNIAADEIFNPVFSGGGCWLGVRYLAENPNTSTELLQKLASVPLQPNDSCKNVKVIAQEKLDERLGQ